MKSSGEALRDAALTLLRARRASIIRDLTRAAIRIALDQGTVTADDVRAVVPIPAGIRPAVVGAAMRDAADAGAIEHTGTYRRSTRPVAHARPLPIWRLADPAAAVAWLATNPPIVGGDN